jgi:hypothetical protein
MNEAATQQDMAGGWGWGVGVITKGGWDGGRGERGERGERGKMGG